MTDEEIDALSIGEVRAIAERAGAALEQLRAVQGLMGAPVGTIYNVPHDAHIDHSGDVRAQLEALDPAAAHRRRQFQPVDQGQPRALRLSTSEQAERERLLAKMRPDPNLPEDMQRAESGE